MIIHGDFPRVLNHVVLDGVSSMSQPKVGVRKANHEVFGEMVQHVSDVRLVCGTVR